MSKVRKVFGFLADQRRDGMFDYWTIGHFFAGVIIALVYINIARPYMKIFPSQSFFIGFIVTLITKIILEIVEYSLFHTFKRILHLSHWRESFSNRFMDIFAGLIEFLIAYPFLL